MRESGQSWKELLVDLKARGLVVAPQAAIGDGALGFWKALDEAFPTTRHQRCLLDIRSNVLDKLPKSMQPNAHKDLREIWLFPNRGAAEAALTTFAEKIGAQIRQGRRMPDQGSSDAADVLRPSRRSLGPLANFEPDRERVRDSEASHRPHEGRAVAGHRSSHGVQTGDGRVQDLAAIARSKPVAESRQRYKVQRRSFRKLSPKSNLLLDLRRHRVFCIAPELAPNAGPASREIPASLWTCPERWTAYGGISLSYDAIGRLEAPMDFTNSVGVLLPMELWGRCDCTRV